VPITTPSSSTTPKRTRNPTHTAIERFAPHRASMMKPPLAETSTPKKITGAIHQRVKPR